MLGCVAMLMLVGASFAVADEKMESKPMKAAKGDVAATLEANERAICDAFKSKDAAAAMSLMDKEGVGADMNGFMPVSMIPDMMKDYELRSYTMRDFKATMINKDAYLATYTMNSDASYKGQPMPPLPTYVSTVWVKRGSKWTAMFHQESMGMPPAASSSN
jgi:hypothetical protein